MSKIIGSNANFAGPTPLEQKQEMARLIEMLKNSTGIKCDVCENESFIEVTKLRKVSGLVTGIGRDMVIPVPVYACSDCGHINEIFSRSSGLPFEEKDEKPDDKAPQPVDTPTGE